MTKRLLLAAFVGLALSGPARAQDKSARHDASMADLTASYNVQQSEIQSLRDKGWSWNDIGSGLAISKRSAQPLQELVAQKDSGMSWSQIADKNGFKLSEVQREARQVAKDFRRADAQVRREAATDTETPGAGGTGESLPSEANPDTPSDSPGSPGVTPSAPAATP